MNMHIALPEPEIEITLPETPEERAAREKRDAAARSRLWRGRVKLSAAVDRALVDAFLDLQAERGATPADITLRDVIRAGKARLVEAGLRPGEATAAIARRLQPDHPAAADPA